MNKNTMITIVVIVIAVVAVSYFNREHHDKSPNSLTEAGHEIGHELDEMGDDLKNKRN